MITERAPSLRRADLFAREKREGWDAWGDEVEKFSSPSTSAERKTVLIHRRAARGAVMNAYPVPVQRSQIAAVNGRRCHWS